MSTAQHNLTTLAKQTIVYGISGAALQFIGLITLPVFSRVFTPAQYGVIELGGVFFSLLATVTDFGMASASQRNYFAYTNDQPRQRGTVMLTAVLMSVAVGTVLAVILTAASGPLARGLFESRGHGSLLVVVAATLPLGAVAQFAREAMRLKFRAWHYMTSAIVAAGVGAAVSLAEVLLLHSGVVGLFVGTLAGNAAAAIYGSVVARRSFGPGVSRQELRSMLAYGLPLLLPGLATWGLAFVDRFLLAGLSSLKEVGEYAVANRIAGVVLFLVTAFGTAYSPFALSIYAEDPETERRLRARALNLLTVGLLAVSAALALFAREIILVIAPDFHTAYQSVGLLAIGTTEFGLTTIVLFGISIRRATKWAAIYSGAAALVNIMLNVALIPLSGQVGSAIATAVAFGLLAYLYYRKSQQLYPTPYEPHRVIRAHLVSAPLFALGLVSMHPLVLSIAVKACALALYAVALRLTHSFDPQELDYLVAFARRGLGRNAA
jgi:O-antigen/teichoic acid export membrane protein